MYFFHIAPPKHWKVLFVLRDVHDPRSESLAEYYVKNCYHLIPTSVSIMEYDEQSQLVKTLC
jgi:hypothetical protein